MLTSPIFIWRLQEQLYRLQADKCRACKKLLYPKGYVCSCGGKDFERIFLQGSGTLLTFTQISSPPVLYKGQMGYCLGLIALDEGVNVMGQITDVPIDQLRIGMRVTACFRRYFACGHDGVIVYGFKFMLDEAGAAIKLPLDQSR